MFANSCWNELLLLLWKQISLFQGHFYQTGHVLKLIVNATCSRDVLSIEGQSNDSNGCKFHEKVRLNQTIYIHSFPFCCSFFLLQKYKKKSIFSTKEVRYMSGRVRCVSPLLLLPINYGSDLAKEKEPRSRRRQSRWRESDRNQSTTSVNGWALTCSKALQCGSISTPLIRVSHFPETYKGSTPSLFSLDH